MQTTVAMLLYVCRCYSRRSECRENWLKDISRISCKLILEYFLSIEEQHRNRNAQKAVTDASEWKNAKYPFTVQGVILTKYARLET